MTRILLLFILFSCLVSADPMRPDDLVDGGYILYFRHVKADVGVDCKDDEQDEWWKSNDSRKTRQLSADGKRQAQVIGQAFRNLHIPVGRLYCSEFRRAQDTIGIMNLGEPRLEPNLTPLGSLGELGPRLRPLLTATPEEGTNTVLVAHGHVLPEFNDLEEGSAVVFEPGRQDPVATITYQDWRAAAGLVYFESRNEQDRFILENSRLTIQSSTGIGTVTLRPIDGEWPELRTVRFEYASGRGMERLEGLKITKGSSGNPLVGLPILVRNGAVEVDLPPEFTESVESLTVHWVDFYR